MQDAKATEKGKLALGYAIRCADRNEVCVCGHRMMTRSMARALAHEGWLDELRPGVYFVTPEGR